MLAKPHLYSTTDRKEMLNKTASTVNGNIFEKFISFVDGGNLVYFDIDEYPSNIGNEYFTALKGLGSKFGSKTISNVNNVSFTEYVDEDGTKTIYLIDINWWEEKGASCTLALNNCAYRLVLDQNRIRVVSVSSCQKVAVMIDSTLVRVDKISADKVVFVGYGKVKATAFYNGKTVEIDLDVHGTEEYVF